MESSENNISNRYRERVNLGREDDERIRHDVEENDKTETQQESAAAAAYLRKLLSERLELDHSNLPKSTRILEDEISKSMGKNSHKLVNVYREKTIKVSVKVLVPVKEHPKFNFVGKLLGPKGNTMKRLQEETMCKMSILGKGSMKDPQKEEELKASLDPKYVHLFEDLHVEISALGPPAEAHARIAFALAEIRKYLIPDNNDSIRQEQLRELELMSAGESRLDHQQSSYRRYLREDHSASLLRPPSLMRTATRVPVETPRVMPARTKILSILERARLAMEDSYSNEDLYEAPDLYTAYDLPKAYVPYEEVSPHSSYSHSHYERDYSPEYYKKSSSGKYGESSRRWRSYKSPSPPVTSSRHREMSSRYRHYPYSRPTK